MTKAKAKPKVEPEPEPEELAEEPLTYILLSGKHSRRLPNGNSEMFYPGDVIPDPTPAELAAFGDKIVTAEAFEMIAATHAQAKQAEARQRAAAKVAKAEASPLESKERDPDAIKRGKVLEDMRQASRKQSPLSS